MKDKVRYTRLLQLADEAIIAVLHPEDYGYSLDSQYNSHVAAFGVSILQSGVNPTLAYFMGSTDQTKTILELLCKMLVADNFPVAGERYDTAQELYMTAVTMSAARATEFRKTILDYAVALKQVIRTY